MASSRSTKSPRLRKHGTHAMYEGGKCRCQVCMNWVRTYKKNYYHANPLAWRRYELKKKYGITLDQFDKMTVAQDGKCKICSRTALVDNLDVDHCHRTLKVRGLLCRGCNRALGWYETWKPQTDRYLKEASE